MALARSLAPFSRFVKTFATSTTTQLPIKVGDLLPDVQVYEGSPDKAVSIVDVFKGKKGVLFSVPGAFTPGCSKAHLPDYIEDQDKFKQEGYEVIACISVNDPFVMDAWAQDLGARGKVRMLADMKCEFTKAIDMELDSTKLLGNIRSKRYMMLIDDSKIQHISSEVDFTGLACLLCIRSMKRKGK